MKVVVAQKGSREHFLAARALVRRRMLAHLVVDWYSRDIRHLRKIAGVLDIGVLQRALTAYSPEIPNQLVTSLGLFGIVSRMRHTWACSRGRAYESYLREDGAFASAVSELRLPRHDVFFGYAYASLEALRKERDSGIFTIVGQMDAGRAHWQAVRDEERQWADFALKSSPPPDAYYERARREWQLADRIVVNSEWTKKAIAGQGADAAKIETIPLAYEGPVEQHREREHRRSGRLRVLWVGNVSLGKGIPYLVEAARMLIKQPVDFVVAGRIQISRHAIASAPSNIRWLGIVPRSDVPRLYHDADVFVLPTVSDNFPITQLEALAHGLPVVITNSCGHIIEDGATGFALEARDSTALAETMRRFLDEPGLLAKMAPCCVAVAQKHTVDFYGDRLVSMLQRTGRFGVTEARKAETRLSKTNEALGHEP